MKIYNPYVINEKKSDFFKYARQSANKNRRIVDNQINMMYAGAGILILILILNLNKK